MSGRNLFIGVTGAFFLLLLVTKRKSFPMLSKIYTAIIALIAFQVVPRPGFDLYNYWYGVLASYQKMPIGDFMKQLADEVEPVVRIYFYIISKLPYWGFLSLINVGIVYGMIFWILWKISDRFSMSNNSFAVLVIWTIAVTPYYTVLGGIRYQLAFTIFAWAFYNETIEKHWTIQSWVIYVLTAMIHNSAIILLVLRIALLLYSRYTGMAVTVLIFIGCFAALPVVNLLSQVIDSPVLLQILDKGGSYYESGGSDLSWGNWVTAILMAICGIAALLETWRCHREADRKATGFLILLLAFCLGSITTSDVFARFSTAIKFAALPVFAEALSQMGVLAAERPDHSIIKNIRHPVMLERQFLELFLLVVAGLYLGYQYLGKLTLVSFS